MSPVFAASKMATIVASSSARLVVGAGVAERAESEDDRGRGEHRGDGEEFSVGH